MPTTCVQSRSPKHLESLALTSPVLVLRYGLRGWIMRMLNLRLSRMKGTTSTISIYTMIVPLYPGESRMWMALLESSLQAAEGTQSVYVKPSKASYSKALISILQLPHLVARRELGVQTYR